MTLLATQIVNRIRASMQDSPLNQAASIQQMLEDYRPIPPKRVRREPNTVGKLLLRSTIAPPVAEYAVSQITPEGSDDVANFYDCERAEHYIAMTNSPLQFVLLAIADIAIADMNQHQRDMFLAEVKSACNAHVNPAV